MMPRRALLAAALLAGLAPAAAGEPECDVSGTWKDSFGTLFLRMTPGGSVSGNYTWQNGTLTGVMDGAWLNGTWSEEPTFAAPRDAGRYAFEFDAGCTSFRGTYFYAGSPDAPAGAWSGTRVPAPEEPPEPVARPECDPRGKWSTDHGDVYFFAEGGPSVPRSGLKDDLRAQWLLEDKIATLNGTFAGTRYEGRWAQPGRANGSEGHFIVVFDDRCETFQGDWTDDELIRKWNGERAVGESAPEPTPPARPTAEPTPPEPGEHLPGLGEDLDDPLDLLGLGPGLILSVGAIAALVLRRRAP
jgi:hypothetical protein